MVLSSPTTKCLKLSHGLEFFYLFHNSYLVSCQQILPCRYVPDTVSCAVETAGKKDSSSQIPVT